MSTKYPAAHLGTLERVMKTFVAYVRERSAFGQSIAKYQAIANKIADMKAALELGI